MTILLAVLKIDGEIGKCLQQSFFQLTDDTANVPYVTQAARSHFGGPKLVIVTANGLPVPDNSGTTGIRSAASLRMDPGGPATPRMGVSLQLAGNTLFLYPQLKTHREDEVHRFLYLQIAISGRVEKLPGYLSGYIMAELR